MTEKKRDLNLDLIRSLALVLVLGMHYYDNSGFYTISLHGGGDFIMALGRMLCTACVPLFLLLSGWLCSCKRLSRRYYLGMLRILEVYFISTLACILFEALYLHNFMSLRDMAGGLINFEINGYAWYVLLYGGLFLMMPFLNMMYAGCSNKNQKLILIFSFFALSILPSLLNSFAHIYSLWWAKLYPICYYFTGAFLREHLGRKKPGHLALAFVLVLAGFCLFNQFYFHGEAQNYEGIHYEHYQVYTLSVLLFMLLYSLDLSRLPGRLSRLINRISELSFAAYLMSWISDGIIYREFVPHFPIPQDRFPWIFPLVLLGLLSSLLMAQLVHWIYKPLDSLIRPALRRLLPEKQGR